MTEATILWHQLGVAAVLILLTSVMHLIGLGWLIRLVSLHRSFMQARLQHLERQLTPLVLLLGLFILHAAEIWVWAAAYLTVGIVHTLEEALYVSTAVYVTVGEGSIVNVVQWRLLAAIEGLNGFLLIGWSTAVLFQVLHTLREVERPLEERLGVEPKPD